VIRGGFILLCFGHFGLYVFDLGSAYQQGNMSFVVQIRTYFVCCGRHGYVWSVLSITMISVLEFCVLCLCKNRTRIFVRRLIVIDKRIYSAMIIFLYLLIVCLQTHPLCYLLHPYSILGQHTFPYMIASIVLLLRMLLTAPLLGKA